VAIYRLPVDLRILGPLEVVINGQAVTIAARKERELLAALAVRANHVVAVDRLVDVMWGEDPPRTNAKTLQTYVGKLRRALGETSITTRPPGYSLRVEPDELDADRFERLVERARASLRDDDAATAAALLDDALAMWRGDAFEEFAGVPFFDPEIVRLEELRAAAIEDRIDAQLALGQHASTIGRIEALVVEHPLRERLWSQLMLAQYGCGRQADALHTFQRARRTLIQELGIEPGPALQALEQSVLRQDPLLAVSARRQATVDVRHALAVVPETRYARTVDGLHIAYQVTGDGDGDLVLVPPLLSHVEVMWDDPDWAAMYSRLASFSRLIMFDRRGSGLSDPLPLDSLPTLEETADDIRAVMDAAGSERAVLYGLADGASLAAFFAASHPERTEAIILVATAATWTPDDDHPWGMTVQQQKDWLKWIEARWGTGAMVPFVAPGRLGDAAFVARMGRLERMAASPALAVAQQRMNFEVDLRPVLPAIGVPTLILCDGTLFMEDFARYLAEHIPGAQLAVVPVPELGQWTQQWLDAVQHFVTGTHPPPSLERVLVTVLFVDIVRSTAQAEARGDAAWRSLLDQYEALVKRQLDRFRGVHVKGTGDGTLATFDGPARAIVCARAISDGTRGLGLEVRAGVHTGEVERRGDDIAGIAVHIASRVCASARAGEVLVSRTVVDLVAGSGIAFDDQGEHDLAGVSSPWRLFVARF
jgi:DNA-binding SARP family transcriptional activator/class 3 adenylate cyclase